MTVFNPWVWRDPGQLGRPGIPGGSAGPEYDQTDSPTADRLANADLSGYHVEATDGRIGSVDRASYEVGRGFIVVDTGPWIFGRKVLIPAGTVQHVDHADRTVYVDRTKDEIKDSPEYDADTFEKPDYQDQVGRYYQERATGQPPMM